MDCLGFTSSNPEGHAVLHLDTEQSREDHDALVRTALRRARVDAPPPWLLSHSLAGMAAPDVRRLIPLLASRAAKGFGGIHSILIDGVADAVVDVNDPAEANSFVMQLHGIAIEFACSIVGVLHFNPNSDKSRGHLGSQLERKSESNLKLERDGEATIIWSEKNRRAPILKATGPRFVWSNAEQMHVSIESMQAVKDAEDREKLIPLAEDVLSHRLAMRSMEFQTTVKNLLTVSEKTAERRFNDMRRLGVIIKGPGGLYAMAPNLRT